MSSRAAYRSWAADGLRFVLAGAANTLITIAAYQLLLFLVPAWFAYTLSFVGGLLFVIVFYPSRVFAGARRDFAARALLGTSYAAVFLVGLGTLRFLAKTGLAPRLSIFAVLGVTTTSNFFLGRFILKTGGSTAALNRRND